MSNYLTTHNSDGKAVFSNRVPTGQQKIPISPGADDFEKYGYKQMIYTNHSIKPDLSSEADIDQFAQDRSEPSFPPGTICPPEGAATFIIAMRPDAESPMHRTMTVDTVLMLVGDVELHLDSGEFRTLHAGDTITQGGTMHKWKNITPNEGVMRLLAFAQAISAPLDIGGKKLETEWIV